MSSAILITTASRQDGFPPSLASSSRSQSRQILHPHSGYQRQTVHSRGGDLGPQQAISSAACQSQRPVGYETGAPDGDYSALLPRLWASTRETQNWSEGYQGFYQLPVFQPQQYRLSQRSAAQACHAAPTISYSSQQPVARPTSPTSVQPSYITSWPSTNGVIPSLVMYSLQRAARIGSNGGIMADFAAQLTCFFWFENLKVFEAAENIRSEDTPLPLPSAHALPTEPFRKWVSSVLSATQVTPNMILLALLFVYRLKMTDPSVRGQPGSEYRLLTVALILANKFLDDNAYTNKTWAKVSGISVQDIQVMEIEFLSHMRYALWTSSEQWEEWLDRLALYYAFCEQVSHGSSSLSRIVPSPTLLTPSPAIAKGVSLVFSPIAYSLTVYQSAQNGFTRTNGGRVHALHTVPASPIPIRYPETVGRVPISLSQRSDSGGLNNRKRKGDDQSAGPPAKRVYPTLAQQALRPTPDARRLPVSGLTLDTNYQSLVTQPSYANTSTSMQQQQQQAAPYAVSLPPLNPGPRAMSTVYAPPTTTSWAPASTMTSSATIQRNLHPTKVATQTTQYPPKVYYPLTSNAIQRP